MSYNLDNLSKTALQKILLVLEKINLYSELHSRKRFLFIKTDKLTGVTKDEQITIIYGLTRDKIIKENFLTSFLSEDKFLLKIDDSFFSFYDRVKLKLVEKDKPGIGLTYILPENKTTDNKVRKALKLKEDTRWENIELIFKSDYIVEIRINNNKHESDYEKMGFADNRKNSDEEAKPKSSWSLLALFSIYNNVFDYNKLTIQEKNKFKKKKQQLSELLRKYFQIEDDPITYNKETGIYKMRMKLKPEETFRDKWEDRNIVNQQI